MSTVKNTASSEPTALMNAVNPKPTKATDNVAAETDKFMTLLITQLKNQDPMNPLDNAQVTSQLAQLSTVTGVNKLNATLETLKASYQTAESLQATNLLQRGVLVPGQGLTLTSSPVLDEKGEPVKDADGKAVTDSKAIFGVNLETAADRVEVDIRDKGGKVVQTVIVSPAPVGATTLIWDGKKEDGTVAKDGEYTIAVRATVGSETLKDASPLTFGVVASVSAGATGVKLNVSPFGQVPMSDIKQIL